jgi:uncharacterized protein YndB with AHSA1/START domain
METSPFVIERIYHASPEKVWQALTDKQKMKEWYFDVSDFQPVVGFEFKFAGGDKNTVYNHICRVTDVIEHKKLSHTWRYDGYPGESEVTWELFPEGNNTRVVLTHKGLHTFPQDNPAFARGNFEMGWTQILGTNLKNYLEK